MSATGFDLVILGAGPAGYEAALHAASKGLGVALVEKDELGGTCLNRGCIPTKLFIGATAAVDELEAQKRLKLATGEVRVDLAGLQKRKGVLLSATRKAMDKRLSEAGVSLYRGAGRIVAQTEVEVNSTQDSSRLGFDKLIIATGSRPAAPPGLTPDGQTILDSDHVLELQEAPESLIVIGAGAIGIEMAQFLSRLGTRITLVEGMERITPAEDPEVSLVLAQILRRRGWEMITKARVAELSASGGRAKVRLEDGATLEADKALLSVGRRPNSQGLGLEEIGASLKGPGWVQVDENLMASERVYAVGDVNGLHMWAHGASHQAVWAVDHLSGDKGGPYAPGLIPGIIYGQPETVRVGLTASEAQARGGQVRVSRAPLSANPIAQAHGAQTGLVKCVWRDGRLVGVAGVGFGVSQLAMQAELMILHRYTRQEALSLIFPHPTLDEGLKEALAAEQTEG